MRVKDGFWAAITLALVCALSGHGAALAADTDCVSSAQHIGNAVVLPAWCTVNLENDDRRTRLLRLSEGQSHPPQFFEYIVSRESLRRTLPNFPTDVPVLRVVFDENVLFDFDHAEVRPDAQDVIDIIATSLRREPPDVAVFIAGHTDAKGEDDYNITLSARRADAVAHALLNRGVGVSSVFRVAFGETMPIADNDTDEGRARNRRVEFLFAAKPAAAATWLAEKAAETCYNGDPVTLKRCKTAITVAEEIRIDTPVLIAPAVAISLTQTTRLNARVGTSSAATEIGGSRRSALNLPPPRRYAIDLGRKSVSIDTPTR